MIVKEYGNLMKILLCYYMVVDYHGGIMKKCQKY